MQASFLVSMWSSWPGCSHSYRTGGCRVLRRDAPADAGRAVERPLHGCVRLSVRSVGTSNVVRFEAEPRAARRSSLCFSTDAASRSGPAVPLDLPADTAGRIRARGERSDRSLVPPPPRSTPPPHAPPATLDSPDNFAHSCECPSGLLRAICSFKGLSDSPKSPGWTTPFKEQPVETSQLVHHVGAVVVEGLFARPALGEHALEVGANRALVAQREAGMEIEDGLAREFDQAARLAMGDRRVAADQVERELHDHANPAKLAALEKR